MSDLLLKDWKPISTFVLDEHHIKRAKYPVIDVHTHGAITLKRRDYTLEEVIVKLGIRELFPPKNWGPRTMTVNDSVKIMDACNIEKVVDLDGITPIKDYMKAYKNYPDRFIVFACVSFKEMDDPKFGEKEAARLEQAVSDGARGFKVHKILGLTVRDRTGKLVSVDDPRLNPIWEKAGDLGVPILIHVSDPASFFLPINRFNPSYVTLRYDYPEWSFCGPGFQEKGVILNQRDNLLRRNPKTIFIGAHHGNYPENLRYVGEVLDKYPNFFVEFSARIAILGRQPNTARKHFIRYQDRILFGTDGFLDQRGYEFQFRFLETDDDYFGLEEGAPSDLLQRISGISLPDEVLRKIYNANAQKIIPKM